MTIRDRAGWLIVSGWLVTLAAVRFVLTAIWAAFRRLWDFIKTHIKGVLIGGLVFDTVLVLAAGVHLARTDPAAYLVLTVTVTICIHYGITAWLLYGAMKAQPMEGTAA